MVFSSYEFLLFFLPTVVIGYYLLSLLSNGIYQKLYLLAASLFFYGYYNLTYLLIILVSIGVNYLVASMIQNIKEERKKLRKLLLVIGILANIGLIGYFKYFDFFISAINSLAGTRFDLHELLLPLGISFFTFQQLSFLISVYKREERVGNLLNYCLFVTFFPQLVAGPIVLYSEMIPQFSDRSKRRFNAESFASGLFLFSIGLFKKAVIADTLALFADNGFALENMGMIGGWVTALSYTLQIYFDFSGYSDMAIGLGKFFNIDLPNNFDSPYLSESISEFWRRWHITLGRALSTYVYKPLGGNRKGRGRTCINLFLTFLVSGLWHGASWTFVAWGAIQGGIVVIERLCGERLKKVPRILRVALTFLETNLLWVLFRAESFESAGNVYRAMFNLKNFGLTDLSMLAQDGIIVFPAIVSSACIITLVGVLLAVIITGKENVSTRKEISLNGRHLLTADVCFALSLLCLGRGSIFIYYNF